MSADKVPQFISPRLAAAKRGSGPASRGVSHASRRVSVAGRRISSAGVSVRWGQEPIHNSEVIDGIDPDDEEHPDVSLTHESEWCIGVFGSGLVTFENLEEGEPMHMRGLSRQQLLDLWQKLARGEIDALRALPWKPGYGGAAAG